MSGPLQWTAGGFVPANGMVPNAGQTKDGFVPQDVLPHGHEHHVVQQFTIQPLEVKKPKPSAPVNVLALAKARLKVVKAELRKLKALEKEKGELERLIAAAESKPAKSNLREIKRSIG